MFEKKKGSKKSIQEPVSKLKYRTGTENTQPYILQCYSVDHLIYITIFKTKSTKNNKSLGLLPL